MKSSRQTLPIKVLLCGLGFWGRNWLQNIQANSAYELVGVVVRQKEKEIQHLRDSGIRQSMLFDDINEAIESTSPNAAIVVVSPDKHAEIIRPAMARGVHILSEKPLAKDLSEAREFLALHRKYPKIQFVVSQNYRGRESIALLKKLIHSKSIGDIGFFIFSHQQTVKIPGYRLKMPSPVLDDMSIHHFDLLRYLTGEDYIDVFARERTVKWSWFRGKPILTADISMTNDVGGVYCASWASEGKIGSWNGNIQLFGSEGCLELNDEGKVILHEKYDVDESMLGQYHIGKEVKPAKLPHSELQYTLENFKSALMNNTRCETDIEDNIRSFAGVLASRESILKEKPVAVVSLGLWR